MQILTEFDAELYDKLHQKPLLLSSKRREKQYQRRISNENNEQIDGNVDTKNSEIRRF